MSGFQMGLADPSRSCIGWQNTSYQWDKVSTWMLWGEPAPKVTGTSAHLAPCDHSANTTVLHQLPSGSFSAVTGYLYLHLYLPTSDSAGSPSHASNLFFCCIFCVASWRKFSAS